MYRKIETIADIAKKNGTFSTQGNTTKYDRKTIVWHLPGIKFRIITTVLLSPCSEVLV